MAGRSLRHYTRTAVTRGDLTGEILREHKLCIEPHRACEDILCRQVNGNLFALMRDGLMNLRDVIPIEIGTGSQLQNLAEQAVLCHELNT